MEAKAGRRSKGAAVVDTIGRHEEHGDDESKEMTVAALVLSSLKYHRLDPSAAATLLDLKTKFLFPNSAAYAISNNINVPIKTLPTLTNNPSTAALIPNSILMEINNYVAPEIPPIPTLVGAIGRRSRPFEKQLTASDVKDDQARLAINKCHVRACVEPLLESIEKAEVGVPVTLYDKDGEEFGMSFKFWTSKTYVLSGTAWRDLCRKHRLQEHRHFVTLWTFRHLITSKLCFAITHRELPGLSQPLFNRRRGKKDSKTSITHHPTA